MTIASPARPASCGIPACCAKQWSFPLRHLGHMALGCQPNLGSALVAAGGHQPAGCRRRATSAQALLDGGGHGIRSEPDLVEDLAA